MPSPAQPATSLVGRRIQIRRQALGLTQMRLGVLAGIDETTASGRINQYERGKHIPDLLTAKNIAQALKVPLAYLFSEKDDEAELIRAFHRMRVADRAALLAQVAKYLPKDK